MKRIKKTGRKLEWKYISYTLRSFGKSSFLGIRERKLGSCGASCPTPRMTQSVRSRPTSMTCKRAQSLSQDVRYSVRLQRVGSTLIERVLRFRWYRRTMMGKKVALLHAPWVELRRLLSESQAPFTRRRCENDRYEIVPIRIEIFPDRPPVYTKTICSRKLLKTIRRR